MKQFLLLLFLSQIFNVPAFSQAGQTVLKGRVTDKATSEGIAFVSIGIEGSTFGTATNPDGYFQLKVPDEFKSKNLYFSAIGYVAVSFPISDFNAGQDLKIQLAPQSYKIEAIDVAAESLVLQRILRTASERIPENYQKGPLNLNIYYREQQSAGTSNSSTRQAIVSLYDSRGYANPGWRNAFRDRNYAFSQYETDQQPTGFRDASNNFDELLEMDLVRLSNTIMNPDLLGDYTLNLEGKTIFNGDSVWTISYSAKKLDLARTGSYYPKSFSGKIYISCAGYVVLRNEIHLTAFRENPQGRSLAVKATANTEVQMNLTTEYKKMSDKYVLSFISMEKQFKQPDGKLVYCSGKAVVLDVDTKNPKVVRQRQYLAGATSDESFWKTFKAPSY